MNTKVFERLERYAGDSRMLKSAIREYLATLGIEPTVHYVAVMEYLNTHANHPGADEIYGELCVSYPDMSRTKVHTILEILHKYGAIRVIQVDKYTAYYDADTTAHAHFVCEKCGDVINITLPGDISTVARLPKGATVNEVQLICIGECRCCAEKNVN